VVSARHRPPSASALAGEPGRPDARRRAAPR
jgi:hypothetical protein